MHNVFKKYKTDKNGLPRWFGGLGVILAAGAFSLLLSSVGLAGPPVPLPPHPPLPPGPPLPHQVLPHPPIVAPPSSTGAAGCYPPSPGRPPYPGWVWMPGYYRGHRWVPGYWAKPKRYRAIEYDRRYDPGPPPPPGPRHLPGPPLPPGPHPPLPRPSSATEEVQIRNQKVLGAETGLFF